MLQAAQVGQRELNMPALRHGLEERSLGLIEAEVNPALARSREAVQEGLTQEISDTLVDAGNAEANAVNRNDTFTPNAPLTLRDIAQMSFDAADPVAAAWARESAGDLIVGINSNARMAIRGIISEALLKGYTIDEAAAMIRSTIGLAPRQADAVKNLRQRMLASPGKRIRAGKTVIRVPKGGASAALLTKRTDQYAARLLRQRSINIARTETIAASNEGQRQMWQQAQGQGLLPKNALRQWIVTPDDRLCPICIPLEGDVTMIGDPYPRSGLMGPPAHPSCRCAQGISKKTVLASAPPNDTGFCLPGLTALAIKTRGCIPEKSPSLPAWATHTGAKYPTFKNDPGAAKSFLQSVPATPSTSAVFPGGRIESSFPGGIDVAANTKTRAKGFVPIDKLYHSQQMHVSPEIVEKYVDQIAKGKKIRAIKVIKNNGRYMIWDGHHRAEAMRLMGEDHIRVIAVDAKTAARNVNFKPSDFRPE